jgi:tetrapyrrole methylase family protein/MazG family protein
VAPTRPALITQIYSSRIASHAKLVLARAYPENHQVKLIRAAGVLGEEKVVACELHEIDHQVIDHLTSLYLPPMNELESLRTATSVQRIVARLRAPSGCPWDRKQTHESLRNAILEEAYEVAETIDEGDEYHLSEELGDLFLLIAMQSQIAHESGEFTIEDVYEQVSRKLIRRHPHVFGDVSAETPDQVIATWESVKRAERSANGEEIEQNSFDRLPKSMPILARLTEALPSNGTTEQSMDRNAEALGVTLFDTVRALIASGRDPEQVLIEQSKRYFEAAHSRQD